VPKYTTASVCGLNREIDAQDGTNSHVASDDRAMTWQERLDDAILEDFLTLTDEELRQESLEEFGDPNESAEIGRRLWASAVTQYDQSVSRTEPSVERDRFRFFSDAISMTWMRITDIVRVCVSIHCLRRLARRSMPAPIGVVAAALVTAIMIYKVVMFGDARLLRNDRVGFDAIPQEVLTDSALSPSKSTSNDSSALAVSDIRAANSVQRMSDIAAASYNSLAPNLDVLRPYAASKSDIASKNKNELALRSSDSDAFVGARIGEIENVTRLARVIDKFNKYTEFGKRAHNTVREQGKSRKIQTNRRISVIARSGQQSNMSEQDVSIGALY
jgi:hypothetical protein